MAYGAVIRDGQPAGLYVREGTRRRLRPGAALEGALYRVHIGAMGFREPAPAAVRPPGALRVWVMGGSTTFDIYARDDASAWPALLAEDLRAGLPGRVVETLNAGVPGEMLEGNTLDLDRHGRGFGPDYVVVHAGPNDLRSVLLEGRPTPPPALPPFALVRLLDRLRPQLASAALVANPARISARQLETVRGRLQAALRVARAVGARPVLATHALRAAPDATGEDARRAVAETAGLLGLSPEGAIDAFARYNALVRELAAAERTVFADVRAAVGPEPERWGDATHFRRAGAEQAARAVADAVLADVPSR